MHLKHFGVHQAILLRRAQGKNKQVGGTHNTRGNFKTTFELELRIVEHVNLFESRLSGPTCDVRKFGI
jgi:hypothetical protein